jgi:hypothetical protein
MDQPMTKYLGRFHTYDTPMRKQQHDSAQKNLIATFRGAHHVAERNSEGDLEIFAVTDEFGMPAREGDSRNTIDTRQSGLPQTVAEIGRMNAHFWRKRA